MPKNTNDATELGIYNNSLLRFWYSIYNLENKPRSNINQVNKVLRNKSE